MPRDITRTTCLNGDVNDTLNVRTVSFLDEFKPDNDSITVYIGRKQGALKMVDAMFVLAADEIPGLIEELNAQLGAIESVGFK